MAINAGAVSVDLGFKLDDHELKRYQRELDKVQERTRRRDQFKAQLGGNFDARAFNAYERELKKAERHNDDMIRSNGRLRTSFGSVWSKGGAAFAAAGGAAGLVLAVKSVAQAYGDAEASAKRVATAVDNAGISYKNHAKEIDNVIQKQSQLSAFDDEDLADSFARFVTQTKDVNEALKLNALATDVARGRHISLESAQRLVARASQGNVGALKRLGIEIDPVTKATDKLKDSTHKVSEAAKDQAKQQDLAATKQGAIASLQDKFRGQAEAYGKTQQGAMDRVKVAFENLQETIGRRLGPTITDAANKLADFINQMGDGTGAGGHFVRMLKDVIYNFRQFGIRVDEDLDLIGGWVTTLEDGAGSLLDFGSHFPIVGRTLGRWGDALDRNRDEINRWRDELRIKAETRQIELDIDRMRDKVTGSLHDIRISTQRNMSNIRKTMGLESAKGQELVHDNFQAAVTAIRRAMRSGEISTRTGLAQIRSDMLQELKAIGIQSAVRGGLPLSKSPPKGDLPVTTNSAPITKYMGGWIGAPGTVGQDSIPAMLAPGEAVLNRHQQAVIEGMLGDGFLDRLFATVNKPHFMQRGGRIPFASGGVGAAVSALGNRLSRQFGLSVTSTTGGTHAPGSYHYQGLAEDLGGSPGSMLAAAEWIKSSGTYKSLLEGIHNPNLAVKNGQIFPGAGPFGSVWAAHANHIHIALRTLGAIMGGDGGLGATAAWRNITAPQVGGSGLLQQVVQGTLNRTASLANQRGRSLADTVGAAPGAGVTGGGGNAANQALGRRLLSAFGFGPDQWPALQQLWQGESGWSTTAANPSSGAYGIPQALPGSKMGSVGSDWRTNPATQIRWGLGYIKGRYGSPSGALSAWLSRSPHWYAKGGRAGDKLKRVVGGSTAGLMRKIRPVQTDRSSAFDAIMGRVQGYEDTYSRWERRFNITDEELVDADTGQVNVAAVQRKAGELSQLLITRGTIVQELDQAIQVVRRIIASYRKVVGALRRSLRHATKKNRAGIKSYISQYEGRIGEWEGKLGETQGARFDAKTDVLELQGELKDVLGTAPNIQVPDTPGADTGTSDTGADTTTATPPSPLDIAVAAAQEMRTFLSGRQDLLSSFGRNFVPAPTVGAGMSFQSPDALTAAAGARYFGAAGTGGGLGGATIINNYNQLPDNTQTWSEQMRFVVAGG